MKKLLVKNSLYGVLQTVISTVLVFFTVPLFIQRLGAESYGVFALMWVIGNLNVVAELGLTNALLRFIAVQGKTEESNIDILVNLSLLLSVALPLTIAGLALNHFILLHILTVPPAIFAEARWLYIWILTADLALLVGQVVKAILDGVQMVYLTSVQQMVYNFVYWGLILTAVLMGYGLAEVGFAIFVAAMFWLIMTVVTAARIWGPVPLTGLRRRFKASARKQLTYGSKVYAAGLLVFCYEPLTKILISRLIGVAEVGFFDIALKLRTQLIGLMTRAFYPLMPFIAQEKDPVIVRKYVHDLEQKTFLIVVPIVAVVAVVTHPFISVWLGRNSSIISNSAIPIVGSFLLLNMTVVPIYQYMLAKDHAGETVIIQLCTVVFNAILFLGFVRSYGYYAAVIGNVGAISASFVLRLYYQRKYLDSLIFESALQILRLGAVFLLLLLVGVILRNAFAGYPIAVIIGVPMVVAPLVLVLYKTFALVNANDVHRYLGTSNKVARIIAEYYGPRVIRSEGGQT